MQSNFSSRKFYKSSTQADNSQRKNLETRNGFNLTEIAVTIAVLGILSAIAAPSIKFGTDPLSDTSKRLRSQIKLARAKAMSTTSAIRVKPISNHQIEIQRHRQMAGSSPSDCRDSTLEVDSNNNKIWERIPDFNAEDSLFEAGVNITKASVNGTLSATPSDWQLCFNSRGLSTQNLVIEITQSNNSKTKSIEVFPGGAITIK